MTEQTWLICDDSIAMLDFLQTDPGATAGSSFHELGSEKRGSCGILSREATQRKLRLFACACMRRSRILSVADRLHAIEVSEQYADGLVDRTALEDALLPVRELPEPIPCDADFALSVFGPTNMVWEARQIEVFLTLGPEFDVRAVASKVAEFITECEGAERLYQRGKTERSQQAHLLRDIFGNPFRPVNLDTSSLRDKTRSIADAIYRKRRFTDLPRLGRALKKNDGCTDQQILDHCQWPTQHVRGCWVVDLVLGHS